MNRSSLAPSVVNEVVVTPLIVIRCPPTLDQVLSESHALAHRVEGMLAALTSAGASELYNLQITRALLTSFLESLNNLTPCPPSGG